MYFNLFKERREDIKGWQLVENGRIIDWQAQWIKGSKLGRYRVWAEMEYMELRYEWVTVNGNDKVYRKRNRQVARVVLRTGSLGEKFKDLKKTGCWKDHLCAYKIPRIKTRIQMNWVTVNQVLHHQEMMGRNLRVIHGSNSEWQWIYSPIIWDSNLGGLRQEKKQKQQWRAENPLWTQWQLWRKHSH